MTDEDIKEIREVLLLFIIRISPDGFLYPFNDRDILRLREIVSKWLENTQGR